MACLLGLTTAVTVAPFLLICVAGPVDTPGGGLPAVLKARSAPVALPEPFAATSR